MREIDKLRIEARRLQRNSNKKVSRMANHEFGYDVRGTTLDPRKPVNSIYKMNTPQLKAYMAKLERFNDRHTYYYRDKFNRPIEAQRVRNLNAAIERQNKRVEKELAKTDNVFSPHAGMTLGQRKNMITPDFPTMEGSYKKSLYKMKKRKPTNIDRDFIDELFKTVNKSGTKENKHAIVKDNKDVAIYMMKTSGDYKLAERIENLDDEKFFALWQYTEFVSHLAYKYQTALWGDEREIRQFEADAMDISNKEIEAYLDEAERYNV